MVPVRLFVKFAIFVAAFALPAQAFAWSVCNETSYIVRVAHASGETGAITAQGWTRIRPGQCEDYDVENGAPRYLYAESAPAYPGGIRQWQGNIDLCALDTEFTSDPAMTCGMQNMQTRRYLAIDPDEDRTALVEPMDFGRKAETAGLQRLLSAAGYSISSFDGNAGAQTNRALRKFKKDNEIATGTAIPDIMDALETTALERQNSVGIIICNRSSAKIWTAAGYRRGAGWEARGWWPVAADSCLRPHTASVKGLDPHIFALKEQEGEEDLILKSNNAQPTAFCIAESRFTSTQRDNCADRGYRAMNFRAISGEAEGVQVNLTDADFTDPTKGGLRR